MEYPAVLILPISEYASSITTEILAPKFIYIMNFELYTSIPYPSSQIGSILTPGAV